jgi:hypothetical protein
MRRLTFLVFLVMIIAVTLLTGCKPEQSRVSPNRSPILSPLATPIAVVPLSVATTYPTFTVNIAGPTLWATAGPSIVVTASSRYTGTIAPVKEVVVWGTPTITLVAPPQVQPFGANGVLVNLQPLNESVLVRVGQQLIVKEPTLAVAQEGWDVTYDATILDLVKTVNPNRPPTDGWMWTVRQTGMTTITFQTKVPPCVTPPNCPALPIWRTILVLQSLP